MIFARQQGKSLYFAMMGHIVTVAAFDQNGRIGTCRIYPFPKVRR